MNLAPESPIRKGGKIQSLAQDLKSSAELRVKQRRIDMNKFEDRLSEEDKNEIKKWDKLLKKDDKSYANATRRDRYHNLGSLDENISNEGRQTDRYDLIASNSLDGEQTYIYNELLETVHNYISTLSKNDQIIMVGKLRDKPISSSTLSKIVECSDKTVTNHFKKHQEVLQDILKDYR